MTSRSWVDGDPTPSSNTLEVAKCLITLISELISAAVEIRTC